MKKAILLLIFCYSIISVNGQFIIHKIINKEKEKQQESKPTPNIGIDSSVYKTYIRVKYENLPKQVKVIMDSIHCGEIDAEPSNMNDYTTNIDYGYSIDLNHDAKPEYVFCCIQPMHGPCSAKIYSCINGTWRIILSDFAGFDNEDPMVNIRVLESRHEGFQDLEQNDHLLIFKNRKYQVSDTN